MDKDEIASLIKQSLSIRLKDSEYGWNGKEVRVVLEWDGEEFDSDGYTIRRDEG